MDIEKYKQLINEISLYSVKLIAVSKTKPAEDILQLYKTGQILFGENKVQEIVAKYEALPKDIEWHFIGHLQSNKVKFIAPFISLIHSVDSLKLLQEINKQAEKNSRVIDCLLQIYIATEETKFGLSSEELFQLLESKEFKNMKNIHIRGLMGMATNSTDGNKIRSEFRFLKELFIQTKKKYFKSDFHFNEISMGMSADYKIALAEGATLVRLGSVIFGER